MLSQTLKSDKGEVSRVESSFHKIREKVRRVSCLFIREFVRGGVVKDSNKYGWRSVLRDSLLALSHNWFDSINFYYTIKSSLIKIRTGLIN